MPDDAPKQVTDTPAAARTFPPPSRLEQWKSFIGELARPFSIIVISLAAAYAIVTIAYQIANKATSFSEGAIYITAVLGGLAALYGAKSLENAAQAKQSANIEVAKASSTGTTP